MMRTMTGTWESSHSKGRPLELNLYAEGPRIYISNFTARHGKPVQITPQE